MIDVETCTFCSQSVSAVTACTDRKLVFGDDTDGPISREADAPDLVDPIAHDGGEDGGSCPECEVESGEYHHPGCPEEPCPNCSGTLVSCSCTPHALVSRADAGDPDEARAGDDTQTDPDTSEADAV